MPSRATLSGGRGMGAQMSNRQALSRLQRANQAEAQLPIGTNDFLWSEDFARHAWGVRWMAAITSALSTSVPAPFGLSHLVTESTATAQHNFIMAFTNAAENAAYLQWALVKSNGRDLQMSAGDTDVNNFVNFDLTAGAVIRGSTVAAGQAGMIDKGSGWFVCWAIIDTNGFAYMHLIADAAIAPRYESHAGDGVSGVYFAAIQREALGVAAPMGYAMTTIAAV